MADRTGCTVDAVPLTRWCGICEHRQRVRKGRIFHDLIALRCVECGALTDIVHPRNVGVERRSRRTRLEIRRG